MFETHFGRFEDPVGAGLKTRFGMLRPVSGVVYHTGGDCHGLLGALFFTPSGFEGGAETEKEGGRTECWEIVARRWLWS